MENKELKSKVKEEDNIYDNIYIFKKVSLVDKYNFFDYIWIMIEWWVSITETLSSIWKKIKNKYFLSKIEELRMYISSWDSFSRAMKKVPHVFETSEIAIVEAWETTWNLSVVLLKLSEDIKKIYNLQLKIKASLTYPIIIFVFLIVAVLIVLTYVIPAIIPIFDTSGVELPFATIMLINTSDFIRNNYIALTFLIIGLAFWFLMYKNTLKWKIAISSFIMNTPLIWVVYKNYILSIFASNFWALIWAWVPVIKALNLVSKSIVNIEYQNLIMSISEKVSKWSRITESMQEVDSEWFYFPSDFIQLFTVWEKTASIEQITKKINDQYSREVDHALWNLTKWIEPIAILVAWLFVIWFAFAIFWAILKVTQTVGA